MEEQENFKCNGVDEDCVPDRTGNVFEEGNDTEEKIQVSLEENEARQSREQLKYGIDDSPPLHVNFALALQHAVTNITGPMVAVYVIHANICAGDNNLVFAELLSTSIFMMGICTFLQTTFGIRLPVMQGSSMCYLVPVISMMRTSQWKCPPPCPKENQTSLMSDVSNTSLICDDEAWRPRLLEISGALICASLVHCLIGLTGVIGMIQPYIGPLTVAPAVTLIGLGLFPVALEASQHHWGITALTLAFYVLCALFLSRFEVPCPTWSPERCFHWTKFPLFKVFSVLLTVVFGWLLCLIFTLTGYLATSPDHMTYAARVDARSDVIYSTKWIFAPYPGYWGWPTVSIGTFIGLCAVVVQSITESVGDYYATAAVCRVPLPPRHALNRGIAMEGFGSLLSGILGCCHATTTFSQVIGAIIISGVASRTTMQLTALIFVVAGLFGKVGGVLAMCPDPVLGAVIIALLGLVTSAGLAPLKYCDMTSSRNMAILGLALMLGLMCPYYIESNAEIIQTGSPTLDQVVIVFLSTGMLIGTVIGFVLDNVLPGTVEERGILAMNKFSDENGIIEDLTTSNVILKTYGIPFIGKWLEKHTVFTYMPFMPTYLNRNCRKRKRISRKQGDVELNDVS